jgi:hypothetical protein
MYPTLQWLETENIHGAEPSLIGANHPSNELSLPTYYGSDRGLTGPRMRHSTLNDNGEA